ncbi:hypothetical protein VTO42DRAFT_3661 [Malbranchea cinnamomea]
MTKSNSCRTSTLEKFPHILGSPATLPHSLDPFTITGSTGFLPFDTPTADLPDVFAPLTSLIARMPVVREDGTPGLLATYEFGPAVLQLPDLTAEIDRQVTEDGKPDMFIISALFRDYSFIASAYLLEPCWENWKKNPSGGYGLGRDFLPKAVAGPMYRCAQILDIPPFMSYAVAYSLFNYKLDNPSQGLAYDNLRLIRAFEKGHDPKSSEAGFILTHVYMVKESGALVNGAVRILNAIEAGSNRTEVNDAYREILAAMTKIEECMEDMWKNSKPADYLSFRVFIFGITSQSMFPNGVVYEGIEDNKPLYFRGESGANDSMIPLLDHLLQIPMPDNPLTQVLHEFRAYRPKPHRDFLAHVAAKSEELGVRNFSVRNPETVFLYLKALDHVRSFRWRHWLFAREYIIRRTYHPTATGGSPIVTWLPNQLSAVMDLMISTYEQFVVPHFNASKGAANSGFTGANIAGASSSTPVALIEHYKDQVEKMMAVVRDQREKLAKEVARWCVERGV